MTADREVLREAVLKALQGSYAKGFDGAADAIVDAVLDADKQEFTVDWGVRCTEKGHRHSGPMPFWFMDRERAELYINTAPGAHELVSRRRFLGDWEAVPDADR